MSPLNNYVVIALSECYFGPDTVPRALSAHTTSSLHCLQQGNYSREVKVWKPSLSKSQRLDDSESVHLITLLKSEMLEEKEMGQGAMWGAGKGHTWDDTCVSSQDLLCTVCLNTVPGSDTEAHGPQPPWTSGFSSGYTLGLSFSIHLLSNYCI